MKMLSEPRLTGYQASSVGPRAARFLYADYLRIGAVLGVVVIHASVAVVISYGRIPLGAWFAGNIADCFSRWAVPVLTMLSGALLLDPAKREPPLSFLVRRAKRVLIPFVFWSVCWYWWFGVRTGRVMSLSEAVLAILLESHLYYLFIIVVIYCVTPWLRVWVRKTKRAGASAPFLFMAVGVLNALVYYSRSQGHIPTGSLLVHFLFFATGFVGYFTAGYYLHHIDPEPWAPRLSLGLVLVSTVAMIAGTAFLVGLYGPERTGLYLYDYFSPPVMVMSVTLFLYVKHLAGSAAAGAVLSPAVRQFSDASFGVYLMHSFVMDAVSRGWLAWQGKDIFASFGPWLGIPIFSAAVYGTCLVMTMLVRRIGYLRAVVGG